MPFAGKPVGNTVAEIPSVSVLFNKAKEFQNNTVSQIAQRDDEFSTPSDNSVAYELMEDKGRKQVNSFSSDEEPSIDRDIDERYLISEGSGPSKKINYDPARGGGGFSSRNINDKGGSSTNYKNPLTPPNFGANLGKKSFISNNNNNNDC